jgi:SOS-response transcriptional repressor LexA
VTTAITPRQKEVFDFIVAYRDVAEYSPTYREIQARFGFKSEMAARDHVLALERKGYVTVARGAKARAIVPVREPFAELRVAVQRVVARVETVADDVTRAHAKRELREAMDALARAACALTPLKKTGGR